MKKRKKHSKKEDHKLLKFFFLALFFILLGITIAKHSEEQKVASYYPPQKTLQIGWFTILKKFINPKPNDVTPTPTPTPCPGGVHDTGNVNKASQSIAFAIPPAANPPANGPVIIINPATPIPTPVHNPCYPPFP